MTEDEKYSIHSKPQTILVFGGAGYIGSHLVFDLCENGHHVTVFDNLFTGSMLNVDPRSTFILGDILDISHLEKVFRQNTFETVIHFAALKAAGDSMINPSDYAHHNITGSINILNMMVQHRVRNIIFSSSAAVYGYPQYLPVDEIHPKEPVNFYGYTKLVIEQIMQWYADLTGLRYVALRYFNAAGYDITGRIRCMEQNPANLLPIVMELASGRKESMEVFGNDYNTVDGTGVRDYIHVSDLAQAHVQVFQELLNKGQPNIFNVGIGEGHSVLTIIESASKISGKKPKVKYGPKRPGDPPNLVSDPTKIKNTIDWEPKYIDIDQIIRTAWEWYLKDQSPNLNFDE